MRHLFIILTSFLLIVSLGIAFFGVKAPKSFTPKKPVPEVRIVTEPVEPVNQFKYPKSELFLGFYSGMSENEFHEHAKRLVDKGVLSEGVVNNVEYYRYNYGEHEIINSAGVSSYEPSSATMEAKFSPEQSYRLVYIK